MKFYFWEEFGNERFQTGRNLTFGPWPPCSYCHHYLSHTFLSLYLTSPYLVDHLELLLVVEEVLLRAPELLQQELGWLSPLLFAVLLQGLQGLAQKVTPDQDPQGPPQSPQDPRLAPGSHASVEGVKLGELAEATDLLRAKVCHLLVGIIFFLLDVNLNIVSSPRLVEIMTFLYKMNRSHFYVYGFISSEK